MYLFLTILFLILTVLFIFYGWGIVVRRGEMTTGESQEKCSICRVKFNKHDLIERQVGDYKLLYFCTACIEGLKSELDRVRPTSPGPTNP